VLPPAGQREGTRETPEQDPWEGSSSAGKGGSKEARERRWQALSTCPSFPDRVRGPGLADPLLRVLGSPARLRSAAKSPARAGLVRP
jgi:hypothetical protein